LPTPQLTHYEARGLLINLGPIIAGGFADGEFITISRTKSTFEMVEGADGKVTRFKNASFSATVTVSLMQTSATNDLFSALLQVDRNARNGAGILPFRLRDSNGRSLYTAAEAWIMSDPDISFDRGPTTRQWTIGCADLQMFTGGN